MAEPIGYSALDRLLHRLAFSVPAIQFTAAEIEDRVFASRIPRDGSLRPIFITSLPRAGTTVLLESLARLPGAATHRYRDMPFVLAPLLWSQLSSPFHRGGGDRERAHGDGITINYDSPEAFEEIVWRNFWQDKYRIDGIELWTPNNRSADWESFLDSHFRKIIALRGSGDPMHDRYVSKNNANIARLDLLRALYPLARIVIPFRDPLEHARSMLRQHVNFKRLHATDAFAKRFMGDLGHYEFGDLHRPILFDEFVPAALNLQPESLDYWLAYWIAAFRHCLNSAVRPIFVSFEALAHDSVSAVAALCDRCEFDPGNSLEHAASVFRDPPQPIASTTELRYPELLQEARLVARELTEQAT